jgi:hypothetical protein
MEKLLHQPSILLDSKGIGFREKVKVVKIKAQPALHSHYRFRMN